MVAGTQTQRVMLAGSAMALPPTRAHMALPMNRSVSDTSRHPVSSDRVRISIALLLLTVPIARSNAFRVLRVLAHPPALNRTQPIWRLHLKTGCRKCAMLLCKSSWLMITNRLGSSYVGNCNQDRNCRSLGKHRTDYARFSKPNDCNRT